MAHIEKLFNKAHIHKVSTCIISCRWYFRIEPRASHANAPTIIQLYPINTSDIYQDLAKPRKIRHRHLSLHKNRGYF